jgi:hypothetical protein
LPSRCPVPSSSAQPSTAARLRNPNANAPAPGPHVPHEPSSAFKGRQLDPTPFRRLDNARQLKAAILVAVTVVTAVAAGAAAAGAVKPRAPAGLVAVGTVVAAGTVAATGVAVVGADVVGAAVAGVVGSLWINGCRRNQFLRSSAGRRPHQVMGHRPRNSLTSPNKWGRTERPPLETSMLIGERFRLSWRLYRACRPTGLFVN